VLHYAKLQWSADKKPNTILWGGTTGPNYDCSRPASRAPVPVPELLDSPGCLSTERFCQAVRTAPALSALVRLDLDLLRPPQTLPPM